MIKPATIAAMLLSLPVVSVAACSPNQHPSSEPGTTPAIRSGSPTASPTSSTAGAEKLTAQLKTADGRPVATATFEFANGYATVTVKTVATGILTPGFHMMHVHSVGKCEPNSVAPTGGPSGDFLSAGEHYQAPGHTGEPASGDLPALQVRKDGAALLVTTSDAFTRDDLLAGNKTALVLHGADHTPDAEKRMACGVIGTG
ncbi:superoxide dismutase[Cu-Zn] [Mycobacterium noviomagense]|uniref:Superoxide dismutase [Cu-Zn] n=1 Tax=Mycobacterium noviomagense TaxID=459858 RepID=A0A7I7P7U4_9MYCO|nr:superoxide dismutase family protein [Mycobacterium noviomagense]ORB10772.1 superoxide dismutase [Mycobacterium noviomagense]BBY04729.1 superoxide dismutase [Cu-Zn] [Mycobacterium noviomagense]